MVEDNRKIQIEIKTVKTAPLFRYGIPEVWQVKITGGKAILGKYVRLVQSLHVLPDGYWGDVSVYVMPTNLGYASFLKEEDRAECERVKQRVISLLNLYTAGSGKAAGKE